MMVAQVYHWTPEDLMSARSVIRLATGMVLSAVAGPLAAQDTPSAPAGADSASIAAGRLLYQTRGACVSCHGEQAEGTADGPSLIFRAVDFG
jgi:mono/diheme cytochrome c family protein